MSSLKWLNSLKGFTRSIEPTENCNINSAAQYLVVGLQISYLSAHVKN